MRFAWLRRPPRPRRVLAADRRLRLAAAAQPGPAALRPRGRARDRPRGGVHVRHAAHARDARARHARRRRRARRRSSGCVLDADGGTRIGVALHEFLANGRYVALARGALVIVLSDGLERGDPAAMAEATRRLSRLAHRLVWWSPLACDPGLPAGHARACGRSCGDLDALGGARDLRTLLEEVRRLPETSARPRRTASRAWSTTDDATRPADRRHRHRVARRRAGASPPARSSPSTARRRSTSARASTSTSTARSRAPSPAAASRARSRRRRWRCSSSDLPPKLVTYGISDELAGTVGLMCGGIVHIFIHPIRDDTREAVLAGLAAVDRRAPRGARDAARRRARREQAVRRRGDVDRHARRPGAARLQRRAGGARADDPGPLDRARVRRGRRVARHAACASTSPRSPSRRG